MSNEMVEILLLAGVAGFVLFRLYSVLGRRTGAEPPPAAARAPLEAAASAGPSLTPSGVSAVGGSGMAEIVRADPAFDPRHFIAGARIAYERIVGAFAAGDREALRSLLTPRVFASYESALSEREARGDKGPELVRLKNAEIADATLQGDVARVRVRFEAELAEGDHGLRDTKEQWAFEREIRSRDPNWKLADVAQA